MKVKIRLAKILFKAPINMDLATTYEIIISGTMPTRKIVFILTIFSFDVELFKLALVIKCETAVPIAFFFLVKWSMSVAKKTTNHPSSPDILTLKLWNFLETFFKTKILKIIRKKKRKGQNYYSAVLK